MCQAPVVFPGLAPVPFVSRFARGVTAFVRNETIVLPVPIMGVYGRIYAFAFCRVGVVSPLVSTPVILTGVWYVQGVVGEVAAAMPSFHEHRQAFEFGVRTHIAGCAIGVIGVLFINDVGREIATRVWATKGDIYKPRVGQRRNRQWAYRPVMGGFGRYTTETNVITSTPVEQTAVQSRRNAGLVDAKNPGEKRVGDHNFHAPRKKCEADNVPGE